MLANTATAKYMQQTPPHCLPPSPQHKYHLQQLFLLGLSHHRVGFIALARQQPHVVCMVVAVDRKQVPIHTFRLAQAAQSDQQLPALLPAMISFQNII